MEQAHKKRPPCATANSPPVLLDIGENYFINLENIVRYTHYMLYINTIISYTSHQGNETGTKSIF